MALLIFFLLFIGSILLLGGYCGHLQNNKIKKKTTPKKLQ